MKILIIAFFSALAVTSCKKSDTQVRVTPFVKLTVPAKGGPVLLVYDFTTTGTNPLNYGEGQVFSLANDSLSQVISFGAGLAIDKDIATSRNIILRIEYLSGSDTLNLQYGYTGPSGDTTVLTSHILIVNNGFFQLDGYNIESIIDLNFKP